MKRWVGGVCRNGSEKGLTCYVGQDSLVHMRLEETLLHGAHTHPTRFVIICFVSFLLLNIHVIYLFTLPYKAMGGTRA